MRCSCFGYTAFTHTHTHTHCLLQRCSCCHSRLTKSSRRGFAAADIPDTSHPVQEAVAESESGQMGLCGKAASDHERAMALMSAVPTLTKAGQRFLIHHKCPRLPQKAEGLSSPQVLMRSDHFLTQ